ncbi:DNA topoisomerase 2 [Microbotryomycetes sp. JL201]|nr:DNA topoisomerase 2 [Microbotryomycetes sp. JL201]
MSSDESDFRYDDDSGSDAYVAQPAKATKINALGGRAYPAFGEPSKRKSMSRRTAAAKPKAPAKKAATTTAAKTKALVRKKKAILQDHHSNGTRSDSMDCDSEVAVSRARDDEDDDDFENVRPAPAAKKGKAKSASETYVKLSQLEHVLKRPDTYIGSIEAITQPMWVYDGAENDGQAVMTFRNTTFVPGLYKIFDEILVNAADNKVRDKSMSQLKVVIDRENKSIEVMNDGQGIPVEMHTVENVWIPELIFGTLLTSSNYDDDEAKVTGGRNGYGAKLANIYSKKFIVETVDSKSGQKYKQTFSNNMGTKGKPLITDVSGKDYTKITFFPDLPRFNMTEFDDDTVALLTKRVYDMAGIVKGVKVSLNGKQIRVRDFKAYVQMYTNGDNKVTGSTKSSGGAKNDLAGVDPSANDKKTIIYEKFNDRWEVAFAVSDGQFNQVSFCNAIATTKGGTHVEYVAKQLVEGIQELVKKKNKSGAQVKPFQIKNHMSVFINCLIANPSFDSQTKENMTLGASKFGSTCKLSSSEDFLKKVLKSGVVDNVVSWARFKQDQLLKKTDGSKRSRITGLVKLEDANNAGTRNGHKCTLILTEGDSAKALAVSGLSVVGRDNYGVFPLRGKLLNVREASGKSLLENAEIQAIKQIMGLQQGKVYQNTESLRYGSLMIMADQDHDGSHIKGLIINFLDYWFPSLLKLPNFLVEFITPIVKVSKGKREISFFTLPEYETWKEETDDGRGWRIKYFKGLGTSDAADAKKYFGDMKRHRLPFKPSTETDRELIDMAFNKKKADDRKEWLRRFVPGTYMDHNVSQVPLSDFINKELILFSMADNIRSIPSVVDGFKPGQRKVLFACFKRKLKNEIKVGQLSGYVSEHSAYHHGDLSLQATIIGLAQQFVGSNNLNVLDPNGQFGTRLQGGKDAASARYIFTNVASITRTVFHPDDDNVLTYLNDDGQSIEPAWYIPVMPMCLVNGSDGIGTGWSSSVPNYNPSDIVANLKRKMKGQELEPMHPWYRGFRGTIEKAEKDGFKVTGLIQMIDDSTVEITELPIRTWTQSYKELLESWVVGTEKAPALIKDYKEYHTDTTVHFIITLTEAGKGAIKKEGLEKAFKMTGKISTSNMVMFDPHGKIKKYATPEQVIEDFYDVRLEYYHKRKAYVVNELTNAHDKVSNQARFIQMMIKKELVLSNRKKASIVAELRDKNFRPFPKVQKAVVAGAVDQELEEELDDPEAAASAEGSDSDFDYLLSMSFSSLTAERVAKLLAERDERERQLTELLKLSAQDLWERDLDKFEQEWEQLLDNDVIAQQKSLRAAKLKGKPAKKTKKARSDYSDDDDSVDAYEYVPTQTKRATSKPPVAKKPTPALSEDDQPAPVAKAKPKPAAVKKQPVPLPESDGESDFEGHDDTSEVVPRATTARARSRSAAPVILPTSPAKRRSVEVESDSADDLPKAPPVKKQVVKQVAARKTVVESDSDDMDDIFTRPSKPPPAHSPPKAAVSAVKKTMTTLTSQAATAKKPAAAPKKMTTAMQKKKTVAKKAASSEEEDEFDEPDEDEDGFELEVVSEPRATTSRRAAAATKARPAYVMDLSSDEEDGRAANESSFALGSD